MHFMEPWGWVWMLVWIGALLLTVWLLVHQPTQRTSVEDAQAILRVRFARGEITQSEFERARDALLVDQRETIR